MNPDFERRAMELFERARELAPDERRAFVEREAAGDVELVRAVGELLDEDDPEGSFLAHPIVGPDFVRGAAYDVEGRLGNECGEAEDHPASIGPYRILGVIGRGGMGIVYRAQQKRPRREVALKIMHAGLGERAQHLFDREAEALGRLQHAGIAQIHECGTANFGRGPVPFLVMERIEGLDLVAYAQKERVDVRARVKLLANVARAIQHAHNKGVVHRDLKPKNVLVTPSGEPKIVDFGLARMEGEGLSRAAEADDRQVVMGTLAYMSPEQVTGPEDDVDATSDVYSLGATAFELLSGSPPFDLRGRNFVAALAHVSREEPLALRTLAPQIDYDLVAIVEKAMQKDRSNRYGSADALAEDLERWIRREPVQARPVGRTARLGKLIRRNPALSGTVSVAFALLMAGLVSNYRALRAERSRLSEMEHGEEVLAFVEEALGSAGDPRIDGTELPVSHVLREAERNIADRFPDHPLTRARIMATLGISLYHRAHFEEAVELLRKCYELRAEELGPGAVDTLAARHDLAVALVPVGELAEAESHFEEVLEGRRTLLGEEAKDTRQTADWLGMLLLQHDPATSAELFRVSLEALRRVEGNEARKTLAAKARLAQALWRIGRSDEAEQALREVLETLRRVCGTQEFEPYETANSLAVLLVEKGRFREARELLDEALSGYERLRGEDHPDTLVVRRNLQTAKGHLETEVSEPVEEQDPPSSPLGLALMVNLANQKFYKGKVAEAEADLSTAIAGFERLGGQENYLCAAKQSLSGVFVAQGDLQAAVRVLDEAIEIHRQAGTAESALAWQARAQRAECLRRLGRLDEALVILEEVHEALAREAGPTAIYTLNTRVSLAAVLADMGRMDEAFEHSSAAIRTAEESWETPNLYTEIFRLRYGRTLTQMERFDEAERELLLARERLVELSTAQGHYPGLAAESLQLLYEAWTRTEDAEHWQRERAVNAGEPPESAMPENAAER